MTADGEQTGQDAERTNERAKRLGQFIKGTLQAAEGIEKKNAVVFKECMKKTF